MVLAASKLNPTSMERYQKLPMSRRSITRRIFTMGDDVKKQLKERAKDFMCYSLALDDSTDVTNTSQLAIFIRGVDCNMDVTEELLDLIPMHGTTTAKDIFHCLENALEEMELPWDKLFSVATDGAPAMIGIKNGVVKLVRDKLESLGLKDDFISVHCLIHRENLCAKSVGLKGVMNVVVKTINFIEARALNNRQFKTLLEDFDEDFDDLTYYCEVRWLSRSHALERFFRLREVIGIFMQSKEKPVPELEDVQWVQDLAFLADMCKHLNMLNLNLQGENKLITDLVDSIKAFKDTLALLEEHLTNKNFSLFPFTKEIVDARLAEDDCSDINTENYVQVVQDVKRSFQEKFSDFESLDPLFNLFAVPYSVSPNDAPEKFKIELIYLQNDRVLKEKYRNAGSAARFYENFPRERFPEIFKLAVKITCMFGSTYVCESTFSLMKFIKSRLRNAISDSHLSAALRLVCSKISPQISALSKRKRQRTEENAMCLFFLILLLLFLNCDKKELFYHNVLEMFLLCVGERIKRFYVESIYVNFQI